MSSQCYDSSMASTNGQLYLTWQFVQCPRHILPHKPKRQKRAKKEGNMLSAYLRLSQKPRRSGHVQPNIEICLDHAYVCTHTHMELSCALRTAHALSRARSARQNHGTR